MLRQGAHAPTGRNTTQPARAVKEAPVASHTYGGYKARLQAHFMDPFWRPRGRRAMVRNGPAETIAAFYEVTRAPESTHYGRTESSGDGSWGSLPGWRLIAMNGGDADTTGRVEALLATPDLADALESEQFRHFLDQIPIAIVVAEIRGEERITYANPEFERLSGQSAAEIDGKPWAALRGRDEIGDAVEAELGTAIVASSDRIGTFVIDHGDDRSVVVDAYSNVIQDENGRPAFRLAALVDVTGHDQAHREAMAQRLAEKDTQLREIQHRVKNNLQMITALIRIEARNTQNAVAEPFDRLAGRIEAIGLIHDLLSDNDNGKTDEVDLGVYLSAVASAAMKANAVEGIRFDLKVDTYPVSVNVAMPAGMVVNELLINAFKHAFVGREGGTVSMHSLADGQGCRVVVADDGIGFPPGTEWPQRGKLAALIVRSLRDNAKADLTVESTPGKGTRVTITFKRSTSASESTV